MLFWLPNGYSVDDPAGFGYDVAVIWARQMPNLFLTRPSSPAERDDPSRSYRRFTTFEVRLSYSRLGGRGGIHDVARNAVGTSSLDYRFDVVAIEPRLAFDFGPMSSPSSGRFTLGGVLGHIAAARFASAADITAPEASAPPEEFRDFYGAMLLGFGGRIGFGSNGHDAAALVPCVDLLIPLTSISIGSTWLPFSVRLGLGIQWPI
jgi:hypothetical protein